MNTADHVLDCLGQRCPLPIIAAAKLMPTLAIGDVLAVLADDPAARTDFPAWCRLRGHEFVDEEPGPTYLIRKWV